MGDLTPAGCFADPPDTPGCGATAQGLDSVADVAVSPDGTSVYAVDESGDDAIVRFDRSPNGALTPMGCFSDVGNPSGCAGTAQGLDGADGVAVSSDGASVYVASQDDDAIVRFDRAPSGALTPAGCIEDIEKSVAPADGSCDDIGPAGEAQGLGAPFDVVVSPAGNSVYVSAFVDDAIVRFARAPGGALSAPTCIEDTDTASTGCGQLEQGLDGVYGVAISSDGTSVYTASQDDDAVVSFDRAPGGSLANASCIEDLETNGPCDDIGPAGEAQGLDFIRNLAVSPDGGSVYTASLGDNAIARFDRAPGGELTPAGCVSDTGTGAPCSANADGLNNATRLAVSADSANVYVAAGSSSAVVSFDRASGGALSNPSCIEDVEEDGPCDDVGPAGEAQGLDGASGVAVSPDGASVYVTGLAENALVRFDREVPPVPPVDGEQPDTAPPDTQITAKPKSKTKKKTVTFEFTSTEAGSTFECGLDGKAFQPCSSPNQVKAKKGKHEFRVRATDAAGNVDPTPASGAWKVKKKKKKK